MVVKAERRRSATHKNIAIFVAPQRSKNVKRQRERDVKGCDQNGPVRGFFSEKVSDVSVDRQNNRPVCCRVQKVRPDDANHLKIGVGAGTKRGKDVDSFHRGVAR